MAVITEVAVGNDGDVCVVCGIPLEGQTVVTYSHNGDRIVLCSNECLKEFVVDPEKYLFEAEEDED